MDSPQWKQPAGPCPTARAPPPSPSPPPCGALFVLEQKAQIGTRQLKTAVAVGVALCQCQLEAGTPLLLPMALQTPDGACLLPEHPSPPRLPTPQGSCCLGTPCAPSLLRFVCKHLKGHLFCRAPCRGTLLILQAGMAFEADIKQSRDIKHSLSFKASQVLVLDALQVCLQKLQ